MSLFSTIKYLFCCIIICGILRYKECWLRARICLSRMPVCHFHPFSAHKIVPTLLGLILNPFYAAGSSDLNQYSQFNYLSHFDDSQRFLYSQMPFLEPDQREVWDCTLSSPFLSLDLTAILSQESVLLTGKHSSSQCSVDSTDNVLLFTPLNISFLRHMSCLGWAVWKVRATSSTRLRCRRNIQGFAMFLRGFVFVANSWLGLTLISEKNLTIGLQIILCSISTIAQWLAVSCFNHHIYLSHSILYRGSFVPALAILASFWFMLSLDSKTFLLCFTWPRCLLLLQAE